MSALNNNYQFKLMSLFTSGVADKPNPPTNLWLRRDEEYSYQFELNWHAPASIANQTLTKYTAEVFILSNYNIVCSLNLAPEHSFATFLANDYHLPRTNLYFVLSSSTFTGQSDFICKRQTMEPGMFKVAVCGNAEADGGT